VPVKIAMTNKDQGDNFMANSTPKNSWRKAYNMAKNYFFHSEEKLVAWFLLIGSILCIVGFVALMAALTWWSSTFYTILIAKDLASFIVSIEQFSLIMSGLIAVSSLKENLLGRLSIRWRSWLTNTLVDDLFDKKN
jgi:putative ATP-binding cassette transporter